MPRPNLVRVFAYYDGRPLRKTWDGDTLVDVSPTTPARIQDHNTSALPCTMDDRCEMCHPELKKVKT
jgi:hypothetical protein